MLDRPRTRSSKLHLAVGSVIVLLVAAAFVWLILTTPEVAAAVVIVSGGLIQLDRQKRTESRMLAEQDLRAKKAPVYKGFIDFWLDFMMQGKLGKRRPTDVDVQKFFVKFTGDLMVWGSDDVVRKYIEFRTRAQEPTSVSGSDSARNSDIMYLLEDFVFEVRADLGHDNAGLRRGDLLRLFVNDLDEHPPVTPEASATHGQRAA